MDALTAIFSCIGEAKSQIESDIEKFRESNHSSHKHDSDACTTDLPSKSNKDRCAGDNNANKEGNERKILNQFRQVLSETGDTNEDYVKAIHRLRAIVDREEKEFSCANAYKYNSDGDKDKFDENFHPFIHDNFIGNGLSPISTMKSVLNGEEGNNSDDILSNSSTFFSSDHNKDYTDALSFKARINHMKKLLKKIDHEVNNNYLEKQKQHDKREKTLLSVDTMNSSCTKKVENHRKDRKKTVRIDERNLK